MMPASPIILKPWLRPMPWGGFQLSNLLDGSIDSNPIGEAWLLSDHPLHFSQLLADRESTLRDYLQETKSVEQGAMATPFPLLIRH